MCWPELLCKVSMAYIKVDDREVQAELVAGLNHKTPACSSEDSCKNGANERSISSEVPSTSCLMTQHLHWPAFTRCTLHALQKSSSLKVVCAAVSVKVFAPSRLQFQGNIIFGFIMVYWRNCLLCFLEIIQYFASYEDDLRLSPLTGPVISADWGCRG